MTRPPTPKAARASLRIPAAALVLALAAPAAAAQDLPLVTPEDYGRWETPGFPTLSPDGTWIAYAVSRVDGTSELRLRSLEEDSARVYEWGRAPRFSPDGRWFMWTAGVSPEERERLARSERPAPATTMLMDLAGGGTQEFEGASSASFDPSGRYLALRSSPPGEPRGKGADLRVITLADGAVATFANVSSLAWSPVAPLLALVVGTGSDLGNGVQIYDAGAGTLRSADASGSSYQSLRWRDDSSDLLVLRSREPASADDTAYDLLAWRGAEAGAPPMVLDGAAAGIPDTLDIGARGPAWSEDGAMISFGLRVIEEDDEAEEDEEAEEAEEAPEGTENEGEEAAGAGQPPEDEPDLPGVQIWHTRDIDLFPAQRRFGGGAGQSLLALWRLDENRVSVVGSDLETGSRLLGGWETALEETDEPYPWGAKFGRPYRDVWAVDTRTGERRRILTRVRHAWPSTGGGWMVRWDGSAYHSMNLRTGEEYDVTSAIDAEFGDVDRDTPTDLTPPVGFGPAGWMEDDAALLLYDKHDIWRVEPDGSNPVRLTRGAESGVTYRMTGVAPDDDEPGIDPDSRPYLSLYNEKTEERGYARFNRGWTEARTLILEHASVSGLVRADSADVLFYRVSAFDDPPDYFVAGPDLEDPLQVTAINPFISEVAWGRAELVDFVSEAGRDLQFVLLYPANYEAGAAVPTIVYTYEMLSPQMHSFRVPRETDYYNFTAWTQQGYAVLLPDIVYRARDPGVSALESVRAAVATAVEMGVTDPDAVGLIGHSWGGYQATYLPTRTDIFAASVAGAPLTNFVSFMGQLHWGPGIAEVSHWETGQARMEVPFWEDPEAHRRNSPIHEVHNMETPLLMAFGDEDGTVDFDQGTEFFNFARRAEKQMVLLVYEGEDHGLAQEGQPEGLSPPHPGVVRPLPEGRAGARMDYGRNRVRGSGGREEAGGGRQAAGRLGTGFVHGLPESVDEPGRAPRGAKRRAGQARRGARSGAARPRSNAERSGPARMQRASNAARALSADSLAQRGPPVGGKGGDDDLPGLLVPEIVDAQAPARITRVRAALDVPVDRVAAAVPRALEGVASAGKIEDAVVDVADPAVQLRVPAAHPPVPVLVREPAQTLRRQHDVLELGAAQLPPRRSGEGQPARQALVAPLGHFVPLGRERDLRVRVAAQRPHQAGKLLRAPAQLVPLPFGVVGPALGSLVAAAAGARLLPGLSELAPKGHGRGGLRGRRRALPHDRGGRPAPLARRGGSVRRVPRRDRPRGSPPDAVAETPRPPRRTARPGRLAGNRVEAQRVAVAMAETHPLLGGQPLKIPGRSLDPAPVAQPLPKHQRMTRPLRPCAEPRPVESPRAQKNGKRLAHRVAEAKRHGGRKHPDRSEARQRARQLAPQPFQHGLVRLFRRHRNHCVGHVAVRVLQRLEEVAHGLIRVDHNRIERESPSVLQQGQPFGDSREHFGGVLRHRHAGNHGMIAHFDADRGRAAGDLRDRHRSGDLPARPRAPLHLHGPPVGAGAPNPHRPARRPVHSMLERAVAQRPARQAVAEALAHPLQHHRAAHLLGGRLRLGRHLGLNPDAVGPRTGRRRRRARGGCQAVLPLHLPERLEGLESLFGHSCFTPRAMPPNLAASVRTAPD